MKYIATCICFIAVILISGFHANAQDKYVRNVDYYFDYPNVVITFDLKHSNPETKFQVDAVAETSRGRTFQIKSAQGAIGKNIRAGNGKQILWNIVEDVSEIGQDEKFAFTVTARLQSPEQKKEEPPATDKEQEVAEIKDKTKPDEDKQVEQEPSDKAEPAEEKQETLSRTEVQEKLAEYDVPSAIGSMFLSTIWPGWGAARYKESNSSAWWGIAGWGAATGYIILHRKTETAYNNYRDAREPSERQDYYETAVDANDASMKFVYAAGTIWTLEYLRIIVRKIRAKKLYERRKMELEQKYDVNLSYFYNPDTRITSVGLKLRF